MSFLETVARAKTYLREHGRVSLSALTIEFDLDDARLEFLVEELVDTQQVAAREGKVLAWIGSAAGESEVATATTTTSGLPDREPPAEAERRQLTVLFCDLVDSTRLAAGMDPEDWREVVRAYQQTAGAVVERFDGHVAQYLGDGLLVYFGWPRAHEDDAERAVRAGLEIVAAIAQADPNLAVRVGIHTGPVVVGEMGGGASRETLAMGDTTNVAARLQAIAEPGTVVLSAATLRLVSGIFVTHDLGEQPLKGVTEPVRAYQALQASGVRSRLDVVAAGELTPFIGREQELMLLEDRFAQVSEGSGQAVLVCGEAGIGKSRLVQAFRERLAERAHSWLECRGSPYTQDSAFLPVIELQRQGLGFRPEDPQDAKLAAIEAGLAGVGFDLAATVPLMAGLHGVTLGDRYAALELSPEGTRKKTLALLTEWLLRLGQRQPLVLLMEDLHWMDPSTVELLGHILDQIPTVPVLLLATYRPDFEPPWGPRSHVTPMLLSRFTRPQLADLVRKAARGRDLPEAWVEEILRRADGVPLFAEELTRAVLEAHLELPDRGSMPELYVPDTLQDSLMARLDALGPVKELAQVASVLGREFDYGLLLAISPMKELELQAALGAAVREELFYQRGALPDATYVFKHALIRDAAYESMLRSSRRRHHLRVAETLIARMPQIAEDQPELLAHHLTVAGELERAIESWERAGRRATESCANSEAVAHLKRALGLLESLPPSARRNEQELLLRVALGAPLQALEGYSSPDVERTYSRARELCTDVEDAPQVRQALWGLSGLYQVRGDLEPAEELARQLLRIGQQSGDDALIMWAHAAWGFPLYWRGELARASAHFEQAITLYDPARHARLAFLYGQDQGIAARCFQSWVVWELGYPDRALNLAREAVDLARQGRHVQSLAFALTGAASTHLELGDFSLAAEVTSELIALCREQVMPFWLGIGRALRGSVNRDVTEIEMGLRGGASAGSTAGAPTFMGYLADVNQELGRKEEALEVLELALALADSTNQHYRDSELRRLKGEILLQFRDGAHEAEALFHQGLEIARSHEARSLELRAATSLARLWQSQGKRTEARDLLQPVYDWFTEGFDTQDLKDARALLEELA